MSASFSPDGQRILTSSLGGGFEVWDAGTVGKVYALEGNIVSAAFSRDSQRIVAEDFDGTATVWEADSGKELLTLGEHPRRGPQMGWSGAAAAFSPDGRRIVTRGTDSTAKVWDAVSGKERLTLKGHSGPIECAGFTPDGQRILTVSDDQTAKLVLDAANGREYSPSRPMPAYFLMPVRFAGWPLDFHRQPRQSGQSVGGRAPRSGRPVARGKYGTG